MARERGDRGDKAAREIREKARGSASQSGKKRKGTEGGERGGEKKSRGNLEKRAASASGASGKKREKLSLADAAHTWVGPGNSVYYRVEDGVMYERGVNEFWWCPKCMKPGDEGSTKFEDEMVECDACIR